MRVSSMGPLVVEGPEPVREVQPSPQILDYADEFLGLSGGEALEEVVALGSVRPASLGPGRAG